MLVAILHLQDVQINFIKPICINFDLCKNLLVRNTVMLIASINKIRQFLLVYI
ncbi:Protein of unknown function [Gryllus bimaculatus]|nr:Protein of unknown function [Gryllus bimaculatus]